MKAKRILSLLLTVAMIAACGVTAFAAPTGYDDYVKTDNTQILSGDLTITSGAAMPDQNEIRADVVATPLTDAELFELVEYADFAEIEGDYGVDYSPYSGKAFKVTISLANLGTLVESGSKNKTGFGISYFDMALKADKDVVYFDVFSSDMATTMADSSGQDGNTVKIQWMTSTANDCYPINNGTYTDASIDDVATFVVFADNGTVFTLDGASSVMYANYKTGSLVDANGAAWANTTVAYWHPATVTLGSAPVVEDDPVINDTVEGDKDGVAIAGSDKKYDNAYAVTASFAKAGSITGAGVLFIPKAVLGSSELTAAVAEAANAYKAGAAIGDGTLTIKAAIKDIPRALQGQDVVLVTRPYILSGEAYTYGTAAETTINFGSTGEVE